jgi:asparagine synthase (glutamine-hydrolysing)
MLSGMGADEMFLGYPRYSIARLHKYLKFFSPILRFRLIYKILEKFLPNKIDRLLSFVKESNFTKAYFNLVGYYSKKDLNLLLKSVDFVSGQRSFLNKIDKLTNKFDKYSIDSKMWELDRLGFLSHNLMVCDKATMLNSIEMRVPLLNLRIFKKINNNLNSINWKSIFNKKILKKHLKSFNMDYFYKRKKQGFNPDLNRLINSISRKEIEELLIKNNLLNKILDKEYISELISSHYSGKKNNSYKLWQLIFFYYWIEHNTKHN